MEKNRKIACDETLLDNQADISIIQPKLTQHIRDSEDQVKENGIGGPQLVVNKKGYLPYFFEGYIPLPTLS